MNVTKKRKRMISWLVFIFFICLLTGIGAYTFCQPETFVAEDMAEQPVAEPEQDIVTSKEKNSDNPAVPKTPSKPESNFIEERPLDDFSEEIPAEVITEPVEKISVEKKELASIYVPLTKSLFFAPDASTDVFRPRMTHSDHPVSGKIYYQGENGLIQSFLSLDGQGVVHELLCSYDPSGNPADEMEIGLLFPNEPEKKYATLSVNKVLVFEQTVVKSSGKKQERVTEYFITPQLYFKKGKTFTKLL